MTAERIPDYCIVPGIGKCRILYYMGNGRFMVISNKDERRVVPRFRMTMLPSST